MADRPEADAVAHDQIFGAVDRDPAIVRIDDGGAEHAAAAHGVGDAMEVNRVTAEHPFLAEMREPGVADPAAAVAMIHRVAADAVRSRALDDHVAAQIGHLAAIRAGAVVLDRERRVERDVFPSIAMIRRSSVPTYFASWRKPCGTVLADRAGDDDLVADPPAGRRLPSVTRGVTGADRLAQLHPGAGHRGAVEVHPPAGQQTSAGAFSSFMPSR